MSAAYHVATRTDQTSHQVTRASSSAVRPIRPIRRRAPSGPHTLFAMLRHRPLIRLAVPLVAAAALTACGATGAETRAAKSPEASETASATPKPPERICAELVGYWAKQELSGEGGYGDYQSRGLSDSQNNILLEIVAGAKAERRKNGEAAAVRFAEREAKSRCVELYKDGGPTSSSGGWPA
jgi:hypothetical protein